MTAPGRFRPVVSLVFVVVERPLLVKADDRRMYTRPNHRFCFFKFVISAWFNRPLVVKMNIHPSISSSFFLNLPDANGAHFARSSDMGPSTWLKVDTVDIQ